MISCSCHLSNKKHALTTTHSITAASKHNLRLYTQQSEYNVELIEIIEGSGRVRSNGNYNYSGKRKRKKVITKEVDCEMPYYSVRDVSGLFYLNCDKANLKKKYIFD